MTLSKSIEFLDALIIQEKLDNTTLTHIAIVCEAAEQSDFFQKENYRRIRAIAKRRDRAESLWKADAA